MERKKALIQHEALATSLKLIISVISVKDIDIPL